jgi:hypothetical protein
MGKPGKDYLTSPEKHPVQNGIFPRYRQVWVVDPEICQPIGAVRVYFKPQ